MPGMAAMTIFDETTSSDIAAGRFTSRESGRLSLALACLVGHLHRAIRDIGPSPAEWREAVAFLTEVGHATDGRRQEWVLLFDLIGASALVEAINSRRPAGATPNTARGPFYRSDAPYLSLGANISLDGKGEPLSVRGRVVDLDGCAVAGARVETWQANDEGLYENQQPDLQPEFNLRGVFTADAKGAFHYATVRPAGYTVPDDGPAGQLMRAVGCPLRRPAHLHFIIRADGFETATTQVFDRAEAERYDDPLFSVRPELVGDFRAVEQDGKPAWTLDFTFVLARARGARRSK